MWRRAHRDRRPSSVVSNRQRAGASRVTAARAGRRVPTIASTADHHRLRWQPFARHPCPRATHPGTRSNEPRQRALQARSARRRRRTSPRWRHTHGRAVGNQDNGRCRAGPVTRPPVRRADPDPVLPGFPRPVANPSFCCRWVTVARLQARCSGWRSGNPVGGPPHRRGPNPTPARRDPLAAPPARHPARRHHAGPTLALRLVERPVDVLPVPVVFATHRRASKSGGDIVERECWRGSAWRCRPPPGTTPSSDRRDTGRAMSPDKAARSRLCGSPRPRPSRRTPEQVWEFVADARNDPRWCEKVVSVEQVAGEGPAERPVSGDASPRPGEPPFS